MKGLFITIGVTLAIFGSVILWAISVSNTEIKLRARIDGQQEMTEAFYTKLWEVLKTKAGVAEEYSVKFKEIQEAIMEGRYSSGGEMMKWIQEANPEFDASLYKDVMNSIEGQREGFFIEQKKLRDMSVQHEVMLKTFPKKIIIGDRNPISVIILKNVATREVYTSGIDTSPDLFGKDKK